MLKENVNIRQSTHFLCHQIAGCGHPIMISNLVWISMDINRDLYSRCDYLMDILLKEGCRFYDRFYDHIIIRYLQHLRLNLRRRPEGALIASPPCRGDARSARRCRQLMPQR